MAPNRRTMRSTTGRFVVAARHARSSEAMGDARRRIAIETDRAHVVLFPQFQGVGTMIDLEMECVMRHRYTVGLGLAVTMGAIICPASAFDFYVLREEPFEIYRVDSETMAMSLVVSDPSLLPMDWVELLPNNTLRFGNVQQEYELTLPSGTIESVFEPISSGRVYDAEFLDGTWYGLSDRLNPNRTLENFSLEESLGTVGPEVEGVALKDGVLHFVFPGLFGADYELFGLDLLSGMVSSVELYRYDGDEDLVFRDIEFGPDGSLYGVLGQHMYRFGRDAESGTQKIVEVGSLGFEVSAFTSTPPACAPRLYAYSGLTSELYSINPDSVTATRIGFDVSVAIVSEIDYQGGVMRAVNTGADPSISTIDPRTGALVSSTSLSLPGDFETVTALERIRQFWVGAFAEETPGATTMVTIGAIQPDGTVTDLNPLSGVTDPLGGIAYLPCSGEVYAVTSGGSDAQLLSFLSIFGSPTVVGTVLLDGQPLRLTALEFGPDGELYALPARTSPVAGHLLRIDPQTAVATDLGDLGITTLNGLGAAPGRCDCSGADTNGDGRVNFADLDNILANWGVDCGAMYAHTSSTGALYVVDTDSAAVTFVGEDFPKAGDNPAEMEYADGVIYTSRSQFRSINPLTGEIIQEFTLNFPEGSDVVTAMEDVYGRLYGSLALGGSAATTSTLAILDPPTGTITEIGATGFGPLGGLAFDQCSFVMYGVTSANTEAKLLTVDLDTGAATSLGTIMVNDAPIRLTALEFGTDDQLYAMPSTSNPLWPSLIRIDRSTLVGTVVGDTGLPSFAAMLTSNPDRDCGGADTDGDGDVDFADLDNLLGQWNSFCQ